MRCQKIPDKSGKCTVQKIYNVFFQTFLIYVCKYECLEVGTKSVKAQTLQTFSQRCKTFDFGLGYANTLNHLFKSVISHSAEINRFLNFSKTCYDIQSIQYFFEITSLCEIISLLANMIIFHVHVCTNLHVHVHDHVRGVSVDVDVDLDEQMQMKINVCCE